MPHASHSKAKTPKTKTLSLNQLLPQLLFHHLRLPLNWPQSPLLLLLPLLHSLRFNKPCLFIFIIIDLFVKLVGYIYICTERKKTTSYFTFVIVCSFSAYDCHYCSNGSLSVYSLANLDLFIVLHLLVCIHSVEN